MVNLCFIKLHIGRTRLLAGFDMIHVPSKLSILVPAGKTQKATLGRDWVTSVRENFAALDLSEHWLPTGT